MAFKNTPYSGKVRTVIYQHEGEWYGAALEFNVIESGDSPQEVMILLDEAIQGYVETAHKAKLSSVLNQEVDSTLDTLWHAGQNAKKSKVPRQHKIYSAGSQSIPAFA